MLEKILELWYIINKDNRPQGGEPVTTSGRIPPRYSAKFRGGLLISGLFTKHKNKIKQCQNERAKGHEVLKVVVLHKHHLDS